jgi:hypothetical protein
MMRDHRPRGATAAWLVLRLYAPMSLGVQFAHLIPEPFVVWRLFHAFLLREGNSKKLQSQQQQKPRLYSQVK